MAGELDALYAHFNARQFVSPDPLECVLGYEDPREQEIAGVIAAAFAFGAVGQIVAATERVLGVLPLPLTALAGAGEAMLRERLEGFRYRFVSDHDAVEFLLGLRGVLRECGTLERCFLEGGAEDGGHVLRSLTRFVHAIRMHAPPRTAVRENYLLADPARGSACKRWHLYLRWMVRRDAVDPGPWQGVSPARLIMPMDTHSHRLARLLGMTARQQADQRTALEVTEAFRVICPNDPVRYDFALTRLGIRPEESYDGFLERCRARQALRRGATQAA